LALSSSSAWAADSPAIATITVVTGSAEIVRGGGPPVAAQVDARLQPGDEVRTGADGKVEIQYDSGHILRLAESTRIRLSDDPGRSGIFVFVGKLWSRFKSILGQSKFEVQTPTVVAGIRGTTIITEVEADGTSDIGVEEGEVELTAPDLPRPFLVKARQRARLARDQRQVTPREFQPDQFPRWCYWTDDIAQQRLQQLQENAQQDGRDLKSVLDEAESLHQSLDQDLQSAEDLLRQVNAVQQKMPGSAPGRARLHPGRPGLAVAPQKLDELSQTLAQLLSAAQTRQQTLQERSRRAEELRRRAGLLIHGQKLLVGRLEGFRQRRHFDPHWVKFEPAFGQADTACRGLSKDSDRIVALLDATAAQKGQELVCCQLRAQHCARLLQQAIERLTAQQRIVQALRQGQPLPAVQPRPLPRRPGLRH
jgi:hypothetical protein